MVFVYLSVTVRQEIKEFVYQQIIIHYFLRIETIRVSLIKLEGIASCTDVNVEIYFEGKVAFRE